MKYKAEVLNAQGLVIATFEEESEANFGLWKYTKALDELKAQVGDINGRLLQFYINDELQAFK